MTTHSMSRRTAAAIYGPTAPPAHHDADFADRVRANQTLRLIGDAQPSGRIERKSDGTVLEFTLDVVHCTCGAGATTHMVLHGETYPACAACARVAAMFRHPAGKGR